MSCLDAVFLTAKTMLVNSSKRYRHNFNILRFSMLISFSLCQAFAFTTGTRNPSKWSSLSAPRQIYPYGNQGIFPSDQSPSTFFSVSPPHDMATKDLYNQPQTLSRKIIQSLDLVPLINAVARHAGTKRGRDSLLSVVGSGRDDSLSQKRVLGTTSSSSKFSSKRREQLTSIGSVSVGYSEQLVNDKSAAPTSLVKHEDARNKMKVAQNAAEARDEWDLIEEATLVLKASQKKLRDIIENRAVRATNNNENFRKESYLSLKLPPIYDMNSSPWDISYQTESDDDDWLESALEKSASSLELENILQAEQVVKKLLAINLWAIDVGADRVDDTLSLVPKLSMVASTMNSEVLQHLYDEISDTVKIVRGPRSYYDPTASKSFSFQLNESRFPALGILREKEVEIMNEIDNIINNVVAKMKGEVESHELNGRIVLVVPKEKAAKLGVFHGYATNRSFCFVEPKEVVDLGNKLSDIRHEVYRVENDIFRHLTTSVISAAPFVEEAMEIMARIDTVFARAAFGLLMNGVIPHVGDEGVIHVPDFDHPVLTLQSTDQKGGSSTPIDLMISESPGERCLIISGPNGGGKTVAMKSFGLVAIMNKLAIPIPINTKKPDVKRNVRVDFFEEVMVELGDQQSIIEGESTLMARLNACSGVIRKLIPKNINDSTDSDSTLPGRSLILLDELGGGTDPEAGGALAQAVLEKILDTEINRIVATTHSPRLKALSIEDERFNCATVLLESVSSSSTGMKFKLPTFKLSYGLVGDSYALGAASRCTPPLPEDVLQRAADLMAAGQYGDRDTLRVLTMSLEKQHEVALKTTKAAEAYKQDALLCKDAMIMLARAYEQHLERIDIRLENIVKELENDESRDAYDIVGDTLTELRAIKKRVKSEEEILRERGLRPVPETYLFRDSEQVVIIAKGEWEGETGLISLNEDNVLHDEVVVLPSMDWGDSMLNFDSFLTNDEMKVQPLKLKRKDIALWDFPSESDWDDERKVTNQVVPSVSDSRRRLFDTLRDLKDLEGGNLTGDSTNEKKFNAKDVSFTSSRERKAAALVSRKKKKKGKKKR